MRVVYMCFLGAKGLSANLYVPLHPSWRPATSRTCTVGPLASFHDTLTAARDNTPLREYISFF